MAKKWRALHKVAEECCELVVEIMKLWIFPSGKHPSRKRSLITSTQDELADVLGTIDYFIDRNKFDRTAIDKRRARKYKEWAKKWGNTPQSRLKKAAKRAVKKQSTKKTPQVKSPSKRASSHTITTKTT